MRQPWQIWLIFVLGLAVVIPAMGWLSVKTIQLDTLREIDREETELARREAELQERISSALYRMDLKMMPVVAQEAARPYYVYDSFYQTADPTVDEQASNALGPGGRGRGGGFGQLDVQEGADERDGKEQPQPSRLPSPLLFTTPEFVLLHFQIGPNQIISSPQRPVGTVNDYARFDFGVSQAAIDASELRMREASKFFEYDLLLDECPQIEMPEVADVKQQNQNKRQSVYSNPAVERFNQKLSSNQIDQQVLENDLVRQQGGNKAQVQRSRGQVRVNAEFARRLDSTKGFADQQWEANNAYGSLLNNSLAIPQAPMPNGESIAIREGVMQPRWVGDQLVLLRRVDGNKTPLVQGVWLDWPAIREELKSEVADLLPTVQFQPVRADSDLDLGTALTTIPVQLVVDSSSLLSTLGIDSGYEARPLSGLRMSLCVAWIGLALAAIASASLLFGVIRLSERRAAFVSAVTHELRTPLTTFRMYAEMLAEKMVPEGKQQEYAQTLKIQSDRLSHLVENVLQFARLERGAGAANQETIMIEDLLERFASRLFERANEAEMELSIRIDESVAKKSIRTQPSAIEQIVFNLVDNACKYAKPSPDSRVEVVCDHRGNNLRISVHDHGPGVAPRYKKRMFQPFSKSDQDAANTAAGVGLGLALCQRMAASLGGRLFHQDCNPLDSNVQVGATFVLEIPAPELA